jgi:hypothetical protein
MDNQQTLKDFFVPHFNNYKQQKFLYTKKEAEIIRAKAMLESHILLREHDKAKKKEIVIARLERAKERLGNTSWIENILHPLAAYLKDEFKAHSYETCGPFGLSCETSIWLWPDQKSRDDRNLDNVISLTLVPFWEYSNDMHRDIIGMNFSVKDYSKNTGKFPEKSIAALNGGNYKNIDIMGWTLDKLTEHIKSIDE